MVPMFLLTNVSKHDYLVDLRVLFIELHPRVPPFNPPRYASAVADEGARSPEAQ